MRTRKFRNADINLACMAFAAGQIFNEHSAVTCAEKIVVQAKAFTKWERSNVFCHKNGWEDYMANGGEDYESTIYEWARKISL